MAHLARINDSNLVTDVIVMDNKFEETGEKYYRDTVGGIWKKTSYNTYAGEHLNGGTPYRYNFAQPGYTYREDLDAFIKPQPYSSWTLDETYGRWMPPVEYPDNMEPIKWIWNEETQGWDLNPTQESD